MTDYTNKIIAVDFDGTCVKHMYPTIGEDIGAAPILRKLIKNGARLILWTMRSGEHLDDAVRWARYNDIAFWGVNRNPEASAWSSSPKAYAHLYIDDAALGIPLIKPKAERPYVDWIAVNELLFPSPPTSKGRKPKSKSKP